MKLLQYLIDLIKGKKINFIIVSLKELDKKHNIMFILDSKYAMNANCTTDSLKRDIAVETMGTIAYLAYKNGDNIGATYISCDTPKYFPFKGALFNIENVLTNYDEDMKRQNIKKKYNNFSK